MPWTDSGRDRLAAALAPWFVLVDLTDPTRRRPIGECRQADPDGVVRFPIAATIWSVAVGISETEDGPLVATTLPCGPVVAGDIVSATARDFFAVG